MADSIFELVVDEDWVRSEASNAQYGFEDLINHERFDDVVAKVMHDGSEKDESGMTDFHNYMYHSRSREYDMMSDIIDDCLRGYIEKKAKELLDGKE